MLFFRLLSLINTTMSLILSRDNITPAGTRYRPRPTCGLPRKRAVPPKHGPGSARRPTPTTTRARSARTAPHHRKTTRLAVPRVVVSVAAMVVVVTLVVLPHQRKGSGWPRPMTTRCAAARAAPCRRCPLLSSVRAPRPTRRVNRWGAAVPRAARQAARRARQGRTPHERWRGRFVRRMDSRSSSRLAGQARDLEWTEPKSSQRESLKSGHSSSHSPHCSVLFCSSHLT